MDMFYESFIVAKWCVLVNSVLRRTVMIDPL